MASIFCHLTISSKILNAQHSCPSLRSLFIPRTCVPSRIPGGVQILRVGNGNSQRMAKSDRSMVVRMGIRAVESFDAAFQLSTESEQLLQSLLTSDSFIRQVARDCSLGEDAKPEFTGELFQPVPWSQTTKHGMLPEFEKYYHDKENYVIVNVPPQVMFQAKVFKPSRLCAIFKKTQPTS